MVEGTWDRRITFDSGKGSLAAELSGDEGPLVICVHGFPDLPDTWNALTPALRAVGFRVAAPYLRGYPPSELGPDADASGLRLGMDVLALADALDAETFLLVGHDWGALAAFMAVALAPARVERLVTLAIPHNGALRPSLRLLWRARHFFTLSRASAARSIRANNFDPIRDIVRRWAPSWDAGPAEVEAVIEMMRPPGALESVLATYRSFGPGTDAGSTTAEFLAKPTPVPTLSLFGERDGAMDNRALSRTKALFLSTYEELVIPGVGHFLHREAPDEVLPKIVEFLGGGVAHSGGV